MHELVGVFVDADGTQKLTFEIMRLLKMCPISILIF